VRWQRDIVRRRWAARSMRGRTPSTSSRLPSAGQDRPGACRMFDRALRGLCRGGAGFRHPQLDEDSRDRGVDAGDVAGVAGDDGVLTLPGAEHDVYVHDIIVVGVCAH
jgi:hypothetical protein